MALGDRFGIDFTIDDTTADDQAGVGNGHFPGLLTSFVMTADPGNTGGWAPTGAFDLAASNFVTNAFGDGYTSQVHGTGFPDDGPGLPFYDLDLNFDWPGDITDSGIGDSFASQFGGAFDPAQTAFGHSSIRLQAGPVDFAEARIVPEPASAALLAAGLLGLSALGPKVRRRLP